MMRMRAIISGAVIFALAAILLAIGLGFIQPMKRAEASTGPGYQVVIHFVEVDGVKMTCPILVESSGDMEPFGCYTNQLYWLPTEEPAGEGAY
jgi:hypothetical protein